MLEWFYLIWLKFIALFVAQQHQQLVQTNQSTAPTQQTISNTTSQDVISDTLDDSISTTPRKISLDRHEKIDIVEADTMLDAALHSVQIQQDNAERERLEKEQAARLQFEKEEAEKLEPMYHDSNLFFGSNMDLTSSGIEEVQSQRNVLNDPVFMEFHQRAIEFSNSSGQDTNDMETLDPLDWLNGQGTPQLPPVAEDQYLTIAKQR